jgi:dCTP diphosphatase
MIALPDTRRSGIDRHHQHNPAHHEIAMSGDIEQLKLRLREFAAVRDWDQFHSPKNLSMALIAEAAELVEHFQWLTEAQSTNLKPDKLVEVEAELADIFIYLIRTADKLDIDLVAAAKKKIEHNEQKYPAEQVRGSAKKYTEY